MLRIVVLDSGFGGELFADKLEENLQVMEIIRVIDWRNADKYLHNKKEARRAAEEALKPYLGRVDLIVIANYFLSVTSLKFFLRKYKNQKFIGLDLPMPSTFIDRDTIILTTSSMCRTMNYHNYVARLHRHTLTVTLDDWPGKIDDGILTRGEIEAVMAEIIVTRKFIPKEIILACSQFNDIKPLLVDIFKNNIKIHDDFGDTFTNVCKVLNLRGGSGIKSKKKGPALKRSLR